MIFKVVSVPGFYGHLTSVFPCIVSVITIDNQHDATISIFISNQLYMFQAMFSPITRSMSL